MRSMRLRDAVSALSKRPSALPVSETGASAMSASSAQSRRTSSSTSAITSGMRSAAPTGLSQRVALVYASTKRSVSFGPTGVKNTAMRSASPARGPVTQLLEEKRVPLIDVGTVALIKQNKIRVVPGITRFTETGVVFEDGRELPFDVVVLATGYRTGIDEFLDGAQEVLDGRGHPRVYGEEAAPGLYFVGYRNPITGQLHDIALEAQRVADHIARRTS